MKKVLEGELTSLAHSILKSKNDDVHQLKIKAGLLYEKLCVLSFAEKHFAGKQPTIGKTDFKSAFEVDLDEVADKTVSENTSIQNEKTPEKTSATTETPKQKEEIQPKPKTEKTQEDATQLKDKDVDKKQIHLEKHVDENEDNQTPVEPQPLTEEDFGVHFDQLPDFEPAPPKETPQKTSLNLQNTPPEIEETKAEKQNLEKPYEKFPTKPSKKQETSQDESKPQRTMDLFSQDKKSLNDQLKSGLKIGLNDRLAFIQKLFDGKVEAYNQVIDIVNDCSSFSEAQDYLTHYVKPNFEWEKHESTEQRFLELIEAKLG